MTAPDLTANLMEALVNRHICTRIGLGKLKMTQLHQNWLGEVENDKTVPEQATNLMKASI